MKTLQLRRLTTAKRMSGIPKDGEPIWDKTEKRLYVGDGVTQGGVISTNTISETTVSGIITPYILDNDTTHSPDGNSVYNALLYKSNVEHAHTVATTSGAGFESIADKIKLDGIEPAANNYIHPASHSASIITQDVSNRFVTDTEKSTWNAKTSYTDSDARSAIIASSISDGDITHSPNGNSVFAALSGKAAINQKLDDFSVPDDNTDLNATTSGHGLLLKATAPAVGLYNYVGITSGETVYSNKALFDAIMPATQTFGDIAAVGAAVVAARRDHKHAMPATPTSVTGNAGTVTNATFTTALTVNSGTVTLSGHPSNTSILKIGSGDAIVSGTNTGDLAGLDAPGPIGTRIPNSAAFTTINGGISWYGVTWDEVLDTYIRTGSAYGQSMTTALPDSTATIHARMRRCLLSDAGVVNYYLHSQNSNFKEDGVTPSVLTGADGQVMVEIPKFYYRYYKILNAHYYEVSPVLLNGFSVHPAFIKNGVEVANRYMSAYEGSLYDVSASRYANGIRLEANAVSFVSSTKTISHLSGSIATINLAGGSGGSGYAVNNVLTITGGTVNGTATVNTVDGSGVVLTMTLTTKGYGYTTGVKATTGGAGTNCTINVATLATTTNPYTNLTAGDKVTIASSASNNNTFTVVSGTATSFTVSESVVDEPYALNVTIETQKDFTATTGDKLSSVVGVAPITYATRDNFRVLSKNRGTGWRQQDADLTHAVQLLYLIDYASFYSQSKIGVGLSNVPDWPLYNDYNPVAKCGNSNIVGNMTGNTGGSTSSATEVSKYLTYRGIENFFGHLYKFVDGININNNRAYICNNDTQFADDTTTNYTDVGITAINSDGYQTTLIASGRVFLPASVGSTSSTKITDYYYQSSGWRVGFFGGALHNGANCGCFFWNLNYAASNRHRFIGSRLSF